MTKGALIFPSTITFTWAPSSVIFTSLSIFLDIPKLTSDISSFFLIYAVKGIFRINEGGGQYQARKIFQVFALLQISDPLFLFVV
jgi:hypothetical protein